MIFSRVAMVLCVVIASPVVHAQVYRCTVKGVTSYQQQPCASGAGGGLSVPAGKNDGIVGCYVDGSNNRVRVSGLWDAFTVDVTIDRAGRSFSMPMRRVKRSEWPAERRGEDIRWYLAADPKQYTSEFFSVGDRRTGEPNYALTIPLGWGGLELKKVPCR